MLGGCLSILFVVVAVIFSIVSFIQVGVNNIDERQSLIPNIIVQDDVTADMTFEVPVHIQHALVLLAARLL